MTMATKKEVIREHLRTYLKAPKEEKSTIISSLAKTLGLHRKSVIRALRRAQMRDTLRPNKKPGRRVLYTPDVTAALKDLWDIAHALCAELLHPIRNEYIRILERDDLWHHDDEATGKLRAMSLGTMKNRIGTFQRIKRGGGRSTTKPNGLKELIPIRRGPWENPSPGCGEIDTVVHCGSTLSGSMAYTVNYTDIATLWGESAAQIEKGQQRTRESIEEIRRRLPFPLLALDSDTGSEFINWHLKEWCETNAIELTRSRPDHKNDNAHIEQRNDSGVRKFLGYSRIDTDEAVALMNELYAGPLRLYRNFFLPAVKCVEKVRIGSKYIRKYDRPQTPYQRVLARDDGAESVKDELRKQYETLNPKILNDEIGRLIRKIFAVQKRTRA